MKLTKFKISSKAQGLSLNTIVIAAIVLIVLLLLVGLLTGYFGKQWKPAFGKLSDTSCKGQGGEEKAECGSNEREVYAAEAGPGKKCCAKKTCEEQNGHCCGTQSSDNSKIPEGAWSCSGNGGACCKN